MLRDVTELRRLEAMRRDFVSSASHELRTPVAAIRGYAETLAAGALDDRATAERFVAGLTRQAERLSALVDDLLDLSRLESGGMRLSPEELAADEVLQRVADGARDRATTKGLTFVVEQPQPGWMGQALEENSDPLGFENSDKRTGGQRQFRAARLQVKPFRILELC